MSADHHHHHGPGHDHAHTHRDAGIRALVGALTVTGVIFFAELISGILSGSLALLSDAMHMLSDSTGLIISLVAAVVGRRAANSRASFGHRRVEVLAALVNAVTVTVVVAWILISALQRLLHGNYEIDTRLMLTVGLIGLVANMISAAILFRSREISLNLQGAFLHVLSDMVGSIAVVAASIVITFTGWQPADALASLVIVALVAPRAIALLMSAVSVLMERAPADIDPDEVAAALAAIDEVLAVHDLHIWSTDGVEPLATCHLVVADPDFSIVEQAQETLRGLRIHHSTIQLEEEGHTDHEVYCH